MKIFKQTSDAPYDRHDYKLILDNGKEIIFDNYEDIQVSWFQRSGHFLSHVEVIDKEKPIKNKGFG